jgi:hypothetical protein
MYIQRVSDWADLRDARLRTVVDPVVFRTAELFLEKRPQDARAAATRWRVIERHLGALFTFFDLALAYDQLPIFNYSPSFDRQESWSAALFTVHPQDSPLVVDVLVDGQAQEEARAAAFGALEAEPELSEPVEARLLRVMDELDYKWQPDLPGFGKPGERRYAIAAFRYGGLLFSEYAQYLSEEGPDPNGRADHIMPPVRASAYLAASLTDLPRGRLDERALFAKLAKVGRHPDARTVAKVVEIPPAPTFIPYLITLKPEPESPRDLLRVALEQRATPLVHRIASGASVLQNGLREVGSLRKGRRAPRRSRSSRRRLSVTTACEMWSR